MIDLVVFDCDGVLVDSEILAGEALRAVHRAHGIEITAELFATVVGMKTADALPALARATGKPLPPGAEAELWPATAAAFRERLKPSLGSGPIDLRRAV